MEEFKLDEKDRKILSELQKNSRQPYSKIGKAVKLPKTVVTYRIKRLVGSGLIDLFSTIINKREFGYIYARLFLKFHNFDEEIEKGLLAFLEKRKGMHWIASLNGCYDFCVIILAKDIEELDKIYSEIIYKFSKYILEKDLSIATESHYYPFKQIFGNRPYIPEKISEKPKDMKITSQDISIINLMKQNSRMPLLDISEKLKISTQTARARIRSMRDNNIIEAFKIRINYKMLGFHHFHCFLNLSNIDKTKEQEIINFISSLPSTIHIIKGTGRYDLEFESLLKSHFELFDLLKEIKNKFPQNIQHADSALIYKIYDINTVKYE
jgi:Lrp/AsnC family transcriptional regulator for asnA, asnC and gidA